MTKTPDDLRCEVTGNLCGTDTWEANYVCQCASCTEWLKRNPPQPRAWLSIGAFDPFRFRTTKAEEA